MIFSINIFFYYSICALSSKKVSIYNEEMIVARCFIGFLIALIWISIYIRKRKRTVPYIVFSHIVSTFSGKPVFGYLSMIYKLRRWIAYSIFYFVFLRVILYFWNSCVIFLIHSVFSFFWGGHCGCDFQSLFFPLYFELLSLSFRENFLESSSTSWSEDSFEIGVLLEPFPAEQAAPHQAVIRHNLSLESSFSNRIAQLEREHSLFLLDHPQGGYWAGVKESLNQASTQVEYNALLASESRDLVIRELRHRGARLIQGLFPPIHPQNPISNDDLIYFFNHNRETLEEEPPRGVDVRDINTGVSFYRTHDIAVVDRVEIINLEKMIKDLDTNGPASYSFYRFCQDLN